MADLDVSMLDEEEEEDFSKDPTPISQLDAWTVIQAYFDEKGLVRQQLDSFDAFITNTVTEVVDDSPTINLRPQPQYGPGVTPSEVWTCAYVLEALLARILGESSRVHTAGRSAPTHGDPFPPAS